MPACDGISQRLVFSLQTLQLPGEVWALALHSQLLVVGGALTDSHGVGGLIRVRLFGLADLAAGRSAAVALALTSTHLQLQ